METEAGVAGTNGYTYQTEPNESISEAVLRAISNVSERSMVGDTDLLPPLYETIDPDALDALFASPGTAPVVQFTYSGYAVTIDEERDVTVADA